MTRSERLWKDNHKFSVGHLGGTGRIVTYREMTMTPCSYFESVTCYVNGVDVNVDVYFLDYAQEYIGVIGDRREEANVYAHIANV